MYNPDEINRRLDELNRRLGEMSKDVKDGNLHLQRISSNLDKMAKILEAIEEAAAPLVNK